MTNKKNTRRALLASLMALLLCFSSLMGTTYAWFTDSVTSSNNVIMSGNLDVELEYYNGTKWVAFDDETNVFKKDALWEPGHTEVVYLKVSNLGSLALKYNLGVNIVSESAGINAAGEVFFLSDYIEFGVIESADEAFFDTRDAARDAVENAKIISKGYAKSSKLEKKGDAEYVTLVVYMPETVGNEANFQTGTNTPVINLGINVFATQYTAENDSFGTDYDELAPWVGEVDTTWYNDTDTEFTLTNAGELAGLAKLVNDGNSFEGKTVKLGADINLNNVNWTPIGKSGAPFKGTFIGTGYTISNLRAVGEKHVGLIGATYVGAHIEGVTIVNAYVSGNDYVGAVVGGGYVAANCIKNCSVEKATVIATPYLTADGTYDGGAKAGVIAGQVYNGNMIGNTAKNSTVMAYRDLGGIAGMLAFDGVNRTIEASDNTVEGVTLSYIGVPGKYDGDTPNQNMAAVVGRVGKNTTVGTNSVADITLNEDNKGATMIFTLEELIAFAKDVNAGNTYKGKTVILGADIDLLNMEWTPINGFAGTFDGNGKTVSNLKVTSGKSNVGLFGKVEAKEIKNLTVKNAIVTGYTNVGVVAGHPWTATFTNITVTGHVEVNGLSYVGGVGGKNAYGDWTDITVNADETSYVKAISTVGDTHYRTYVGGVVGFNGEGGHTFKNITTNIDVIGDVCDIGGVFGIAHYNNKFENIKCSGNVTGTFFDPAYPEDADEIGGIAGVWHNQTGTTVTFTNCEFTGKLTAADASVDVSNNTIVGKAYSATGTGTLIIDGKDTDGNWAVTDVASLGNALTKGGDVKLYKDVKLEANQGLTIPANVVATVELNGKTVTGNIHKSAGHVLRNEGQLVLVGGTIKSSADNGGSAIYNAAGASLTVDGTTIEGAPKTGSSWPSYAINSYGEMTIKDATITSNHGAIALYGDTDIYDATVTMNGMGGSSHVFYIGGEGTEVTVNGGTYTHKGNVDGSLAYIMTGTKMVINGGTFSASNGGYGLATYTCSLIVNGGTFANAFLDWGGPISITGGTFASKPADKYLAEGYKVTAVGDMYMVTKGTIEVITSNDTEALDTALNSGKDVVLTDDMIVDTNATTANSGYGATGVSVKGGVLDGNGYSLGINNWGTWDAAVHTTGGTIKNITINRGMRGIFMGSATADVYIENVTIDGTVYTFNSDGGNKEYGVYISNSTLNGWTSFSDVHKEVVFTNCSFGEGQGYAFCRPYNASVFENCVFEEGFEFDTSKTSAIVFKNCYYGDTLITAENAATLGNGETTFFYNGLNGITIQ